jgi:hypothetical protein
MDTIGNSVSVYSVPLCEICYGYHWQFSFRTFCTINWDMLWISLTVQYHSGHSVPLCGICYGHNWLFSVRIFCAFKWDMLWLTFQDILCHYLVYVMATIDSSVSGYSVPLFEICYVYHLQIIIRIFCAIKWDMLWVTLTVQFQEILCHYVRYVMVTIDSSVSGYSVPLSEMCYVYHWQFIIMIFCAINWVMLWVPLTVQFHDILCH